MVYKLDRQTDVGTGTAGAAAPLDNQDLAASVVETCNHTAEPTVTADTELLEVPVNQRSTYRWVAVPGGELVVPAVDTDGIGARTKSSAYTGTVISNVHFWE
jgi:hypothetical protein